MTVTTSDNGALIEELRKWRQSSRLLYQAFRMQRHLGQQWFVIKAIIGGADDSGLIEFTPLRQGLHEHFNSRSSTYQTLSACLEDLRKLELLELFDSDGNPTALGSSSNFPVTTRVRIGDNIKVATQQYIRPLLREFYSQEFADTYRSHSLQVFRVLDSFVDRTFLKDWPEVLEGLVQSSKLKSPSSRGAFKRDMVGSSEYFILLTSLWEYRMLEDDEAGYTEEMLKEIYLHVRETAETALVQCIRSLVAHGVLESVQAGRPASRYRLAARHLPSFAPFGDKLVTYRPRLKAEIEQELSHLKVLG